MPLIFLTLVPILLLIGWLVAEFQARTKVRVIMGLVALLTVAVVAFFWGGFAEAFKHAQFLVPHDSSAQAAEMNAADKAATNSVTK